MQSHLWHRLILHKRDTSHTHTPSEFSPPSPPTLNALTPTHSHQYTHTHTPNLRHQEVAFFLCLEFPLPLVQILLCESVCACAKPRLLHTKLTTSGCLCRVCALLSSLGSLSSSKRNESSSNYHRGPTSEFLCPHNIRTPRSQRK